MSEHVVVARLQYDDSGFVTGVTRDVELTRQMNAAMKDGAPSIQELAKSIQALADKEKSQADAATAAAKAQTAQINTTKTQSQANAAASNAAAAAARATTAQATAATAGATAQARLATAQNQQAAAAAVAARANAQLQATMNQIAANSEQAVAGINSISSSLESATGLVKAFFSAWVVREIWDETKKLVMEGVNFNSELDQTRIGSAAIITTFGKIYDAQGHLLSGVNAFNAAQKIGADLTDQIKVKTLETTLLFSQMQDATRRSLAYEVQYLTDAKGVVASNKDLANFTASFAQGAVTFGMAPDEIPNNLRALLTGRADPRHARFAAALLSEFGTNDQAREQMEIWRQQGVLIQELQKRLEAFATAGKASMNTYTGALSNLHDAWQQLLGEGTTGATKELTTDILTLRDSIVSVDKWGKATFNPELLKAIKDTADLIAKGATFVVKIVKEVTEPGGVVDTVQAWREQNSRSIAGPVDQLGGGIQKGLVDQFGADPIQTKFLDSKAKPAGFYIGLAWDRFVKWREDQAGPAPKDYFNGITVIDPSSLARQSREYKVPIGPGVDPKGKVTFDAQGFTLIGGKPKTDEEDTGAENKLADFQKFMEPFHVGAAGGTDNDPLAKALQQITVERLQAIDHYKKAHKALADANEDWKRDLHDINATFTNRENDAVSKYLADFVSAREKLSAKYAPAKQGDYEAQNVDARQSALGEIDEVKRKFPGIAAEWTSLENQITDFYKKKLVDDADASLAKINDKTLSAVKRTVEIEEQIRIDANTETENRRIEQITNSVDRELATRIAANDRWAAEEDKRAQIELAGDEMKTLREARQAVIEQARIQKNRAAEDAAFHARQAMIAGTDDWLNNLEKRRDEVIPKIGVTLQDTVIGALEATQSAIDKYFASIADGNADLGASADALVHDLGQKWSKVFADALSAPLHGGSILDSFKQIEQTFETGGTMDKLLAGAGIGSFIGGFFGPGNKAQAGGAIGGLAGTAIGSIWGPIGAEIGAAIGGAIGSAIGATMKTSDHISISMRGVTLDNLRSPFTSTYKDNETTQNFGTGSLDLEEKGISAAAREEVIAQVHRKAEETMKSWQQIVDLFPEDVKAKLANFHPTLDITGGTGETGNITDEGALGSLNDFLSNKLPKATFAAYEPALRAGLSAMGEGQKRVEQIMAYWGTMQGTELHDAVLSYVTALTSFVKIKQTIGDFGNATDLIAGSAQRQAEVEGNATALSHVQDLKAEIAGVVASLPKLSDIADQQAAMEKLNSLSGDFFSGLVAGFEKINEKEKATFASLDSFDEQVQLAGMGDQDKLNYFYKRMGDLENQLQTTKDPERISDLVSQIEQYGQQALGLAPNSAANRDELAKISAEVRALAGNDYNKARDELVQEQKSAFALLESASQNLLKASNDLMGRGAGSGRGTPPGPDTGDVDGVGGGKPVDPKPVDPIVGPQSIHDAFRLALDDKPIAIATTSGVAMIVDSIDSLAKGLGVDEMNVHAFGVSPAILDPTADMVSMYREQMDAIVAQLASMPAAASSSSTADRSAEIVAAIKDLAEEMRRTRSAIVSRALTIEGDGAAFLRSVGFTLQESIFQTLKDHPEVAVHLFDIGR